MSSERWKKYTNTILGKSVLAVQYTGTNSAELGTIGGVILEDDHFAGGAHGITVRQGADESPQFLMITDYLVTDAGNISVWNRASFEKSHIAED
jgi:galactose-1-phosphate uridylyltransferase